MEQLRAKWIKQMYQSRAFNQNNVVEGLRHIPARYRDSLKEIRELSYQKGRADVYYEIIADTENYNERLTKIQQELRTIVYEATKEERAAVESEDMESAYTELTKKQMAKQFLDKLQLLEVHT